MLVYQHFVYTGQEDRWAVPDGVTSATFECWGASGGLPSDIAWQGKVRQVVGGTGPANTFFYNLPTAETRLGTSFANNAGYAKGTLEVTTGETFFVYVGGNGGPGHSTIRLNKNGTYTTGIRGGAAGFNGGGEGGDGALIHQNLFNNVSARTHFKQASMPRAAKVGQLWHDTDAHEVKKCTTAYSGGNGTNAKWAKVTHSHSHAVGPSGGGGGGATDIRKNGTDITDRILVAGGGGGAGGTWNETGTGSWGLVAVPATPAPPFGADTTAGPATGPDRTWATAINYLTVGWGGGGMGGATGPTQSSSPTTDGGQATAGGSGGPATARHTDGDVPPYQKGSEGAGGGSVAGGSRGMGGSGGSGGSLGQGGAGATADGQYDDWCAGGGGGGGGYYGGGGGGQGFKVSGHNSGIHTRAGGGGGGSNYADQSLTSVVLAGAARPPSGVGTSGTGANGLGGFARISYRQPPVVKWSAIERAVLGGSTFAATFTYLPAVSTGSGISYYEVGTGADTDTFPTSKTTYMVSDSTQTSFTHNFTAPATGNTEAVFVRVTDLDGDSSDWLKQQITGLAVAATTPATITSPAAGNQFIDTATVDWTLGTQTPLAAYRLGLTGTDLVTGAQKTVQTGWRRGGSRVNLAPDPGFEGSAVWESHSNVAVAPDTSFPGISGHNGKITWGFTDDYSAENHTVTFDNLNPNTAYRLHLEVASNADDDVRPLAVHVWDDNGLLTTVVAEFSTVAAGTYVPLDIQFTPHTQGVYISIVPSGSGASGDALVDIDFEDGTIGAITGSMVNDGTESNSGVLAGKATGASSLDPSASLISGAGTYMVEAYVYSPAASTSNGALTISGTGVTNTPVTATSSVRDTFQLLRVPFTWDGAGTVSLGFSSDAATGHWWDDIDIYLADDADLADFGNTDTGQAHYLANMLLELLYEEDAAGYGAYFDGSHTNGLTGTASWSGTANDSPSYLTGTDVVTGDLDYSGVPLNDGALYLDTLTEGAVLSGYDGSRASIAQAINPSLPGAPTVTLEVNSSTGLMTLTIDAADGGATNKTVSFDIFRDGIRVATGLTPDVDTRQAVYMDTPGHAQTVTYFVRAFDSAGGYVDQPDGAVTVVD